MGFLLCGEAYCGDTQASVAGYWMVVELFCSCDLDLDPMTLLYEADQYFMEIRRMCKYNLPTAKLSKVIV